MNAYITAGIVLVSLSGLVAGIWHLCRRGSRGEEMPPGPIPNNLEEAIRGLISMFTEEELDKFAEMSEPKALAVTHHSTGRWIRNNWGLWVKGPLYDHFKKQYGLWHADDMSGVILTTLHRRLNGVPDDIEVQVEWYLEHWRRIKVTGEDAHDQQAKTTAH